MGLGYNAGISGLYACGVLFVLMVARNRRLPTWEEWHDFFVGTGQNLIPLLLIGAGAGVIIGMLNSTGLAFQLSLMLTHIGQNAGIVAMLLLTAVICIILGMGMPTAAVYIVLVAVIALQALLLIVNASIPARETPESSAILAGSLGSNPAFWLRVGVGLLFPLALSYMAWRSSVEQAMMSATGLLYIAVGAVFVGELLARGLLFVTGSPV